MQKLVSGIHKFQSEIFATYRDLFERLARGQSPEALFVTCADSRIDPNLLTQARPGDLFILRNAGNIVPPYGPAGGGAAATIEFAVAGLGVRDIILCGHSGCGAMRALLEPAETERLPALRAWLAHAEATRRIVAENYGHLEGAARLSAAIEENVLVQIEHLRTHPAVAAALARGALRLHGWVYKIETGEVFAYDPAQGQFRPLGEGGAPAPAVPAERRGRAGPSI